MSEAAARGLVSAAHAVADGGLAVAAAKMAVRGGVGLRLRLDAACPGCSSAFEAAFSETPARILVELQGPGALEELRRLASELSPAPRLAVVGETLGPGEPFVLEHRGEVVAELEQAALREAYTAASRAIRGVEGW
jgi:phosphoribosylformylglycinamidine synthase